MSDYEATAYLSLEKLKVSEIPFQALRTPQQVERWQAFCLPLLLTTTNTIKTLSCSIVSDSFVSVFVSVLWAYRRSICSSSSSSRTKSGANCALV